MCRLRKLTKKKKILLRWSKRTFSESIDEIHKIFFLMTVRKAKENLRLSPRRLPTFPILPCVAELFKFFSSFEERKKQHKFYSEISAQKNCSIELFIPSLINFPTVLLLLPHRFSSGLASLFGIQFLSLPQRKRWK